ncbi:MAG: phosphate ABC transporter permease PstA [Candidatus Eremiobacteraeota bacterium]|nr:phosphate ABC transporter permease PstA [Candidatus Eremiobacteraeota bacterium]MBV9057470.1 phosphate ABC transporter permease PstA [Candidatus Eremiobacteraeota bacterium]
MRRRRVSASLGAALTLLCALLAAGALLVILGYVVVQGIGAVNWAFLTQLPRPVGMTGGGVGNGILGTIIIIAIAAAMAIPLGLLTGIYLALFGRGTIPEALRFLSDVLSGVPSIAIGLFAYTVLVAPLKHFSAFSASFAFMMLMLPLLVRTSEQAIRSVPQTVREGALALGMSNFRATMRVVLPTARPAIITALLLAIARVTGETAPLLFTAFGSQFWETNPGRPMAVLALQVFNYAISPYANWQAQAWGGALLLIVAVLILSLGARYMLSQASRRLES